MNKWVVLLFLLMVCVYIHVFSTKTDIFMDESWTIVLSTYNEYGWTKFIEEDIPVTGEEIRKQIYAYKGSLEATLRDIWQLRLDTRDSPHTNLYYSLFRLSLLGSDYTSLADILFRAGILHLVLASFAFFVFYQLSLSVLETNRARFLAIVLAFFSSAAMANVQFFREYILQELFFISIAFSFWKLLPLIERERERERERESNNEIISILKWNTFRLAALYGLLIALTLLSGYFSLLYLFVFLVYMLWQGITKNRNFLKLLALICIFAIFFTFLIYPNFLAGFSSNHATNAGTRLTETLGHEIYSGLDALFKILSRNYLVTSGLLFLLFIAWQKRKRGLFKNSFWKVLLCSIVFFSVITEILATWNSIRYIISIFPLLSIAVARLFDDTPDKGNKNDNLISRFFCSFIGRRVQDIVLIGSMIIALTNYPIYHHRLNIKNVPNSGWIVSNSPRRIASLAPFIDGIYSLKSFCQQPSWYETLPADTSFFIENECINEEASQYIHCKKRGIGLYKICVRK